MTVRLGLGMGWGCRFELKNVGKTTHYVSQSLVVPRPWLVMAFAAAHRTMGAESIHVPEKPEKSAPVPTSTYVGDPLHPGGTGTQRHDTVPRWYLTRRHERHDGLPGTDRQNTSAARRPLGLGITVIPHARRVAPQHTAPPNFFLTLPNPCTYFRTMEQAVCARFDGNDEQPRSSRQHWGFGGVVEHGASAADLHGARWSCDSREE